MRSEFLRSCFFVGAFFCIQVVVFAQQKKGEIININYKYKIAFTDLTEADVKAGDKVSVRAGVDGREYLLDVIEAYPVMAKLSVSTDPGNNISDEDFAKISVGASVQPFAQVKNVGKLKQAGDDVKSPEAGVSHLSDSVRKSALKPLVNAEALTPVRSEAVIQEPDIKRPVIDEVKAGGMDERTEKLTANMINLSEHIARLLTDKGNLESVLKQKDAVLVELKKKAEDLGALNTTLDTQVKALQNEVNRLKASDADSKKENAGLEQKLVELKKKLARMVDIINKHMKTYE